MSVPCYETVPADAGFVLAVIRAAHRQMTNFDPEVDPNADLNFSSTVAEWRDACDLLSWRGLGRGMNRWWGIDASDSEWRHILTPPRERTLRDVCRFIARRTQRVFVQPLDVAGKSCWPAGVFLTIKTLLTDAGIDSHEIAPSTPLVEYLRKHFHVFVEQVDRLSPGCLPPAEITHHKYDRAIDVDCFAWFCLIVSMTLAKFEPMVGFLAIPSLIGWCIARQMTHRAAKQPPESMTLASVDTFGELSRHIAEHLNHSRSDGPSSFQFS